MDAIITSVEMRSKNFSSSSSIWQAGICDSRTSSRTASSVSFKNAQPLPFRYAAIPSWSMSAFSIASAVRWAAIPFTKQKTSSHIESGLYSSGRPGFGIGTLVSCLYLVGM